MVNRTTIIIECEEMNMTTKKENKKKVVPMKKKQKSGKSFSHYWNEIIRAVIATK